MISSPYLHNLGRRVVVVGFYFGGIWVVNKGSCAEAFTGPSLIRQRHEGKLDASRRVKRVQGSGGTVPNKGSCLQIYLTLTLS